VEHQYPSVTVYVVFLVLNVVEYCPVIAAQQQINQPISHRLWKAVFNQVSRYHQLLHQQHHLQAL